MPLILLLLLLISTPVWAVTTLYVSTGGSGSACTSGTPCSLDTAKGLATPGDTITLANGTYSGSTTINCNSGAQNGTSLDRITLKATNERQAHLSGSGAAPLQFYNCNFWTIEGLHLSNADNGSTISTSPGSGLWISSSNNMIIRRNLVLHPNRYANTHAIEFYIADNNLVEENEVYDFHRHGIIIQTGSGNIFRRNYVNSRGFADLPGCNNSQDGVHPWCSNNPAGDNGLMVYPGAHTIMENNISEGNAFGLDMNAKFGNSVGNHYYGNIAKDNYYGLSLTAGDQPFVSDMPLDSIWENNVSISGGTTNRGFRGRSTKNLQAHNNTVIGSGAEAAWMIDWDSANGPGDGAPTSYATNLLVTKSASSSDYGISVTGQSDWSIDYVNVFNFTNNTPALNDSHITHATTTDPQLGTCYAWLPDASPMKGAGLGGADIGANILYRYQDGALSSTPLWDTTTGDFTCGVVVAGVNDNDANNCRGIPSRFHINQGGCSFPAGYGGSPVATRLGLHYTAEELAIWQQRAASGPYKTAGDVSTNSPGDWTRIAGNATSFASAPAAEHWLGYTGAGCMPSTGATGPGLTAGVKLRDAAFVDRVLDTTTYRAAVLAELLSQAAEPGTDFSDTTKFNTGSGCILRTYDDSDMQQITAWLQHLTIGYDYIRSLISSGDRAVLDLWFLNAGLALNKRPVELALANWPNRDSDDYASSPASQGGAQHDVCYYGGPFNYTWHLPWSNLVAAQTRTAGLIGIMLNNTGLISSAKRFFQEWLAYEIMSDNSSVELDRWTTGSRQQGLGYWGGSYSHILMFADALARSGDTSLYTYSTSAGLFSTAGGGNKSILNMLTRHMNYWDHTVSRYATTSAGENGDATYLIDGEDSVQHLITSTYAAISNIYFRDAYLKSHIERTWSGAPSYPTGNPPGGAMYWGGDQGELPGLLFQFGQLDGQVWPYVLPAVSSGVVAKYLFAEGTGTTVADETGRGHTGTFSPDGGWTTGLIGPYAGLFDGTRYVSISGASELRPTTEATIGVWFKATTTDLGGSTLVTLPNDGLMPYLTSLGRAACQLYDELGHFVSITSAGSYLDDARHFLNCSYLKGDGLYLRVDHTQVGFTSLSTNISYNIGGTNNVEVGRSSGNTTNLNFVGSLDHITLKDTACDTACDLALFQEGMTQRRIMVLGVR